MPTARTAPALRPALTLAALCALRPAPAPAQHPAGTAAAQHRPTTAPAPATARATPAQLRPTAAATNGTVTLVRGFLPDPRYVALNASGALDAQPLTAPECRGFITAQPDVVLNLRGITDWFRIYVTSTADVTLVVRRPDGTFQCSDDTFGTNPSVDGTFPAGTYAVWVGTKTAGRRVAAMLAFTELEGNHPPVPRPEH